MKKFSHLITLLPCQTLEDLPVDGSKEEAQSLLASWTALWHPQLIADVQQAPQWCPASDTVSSEAEAEQFREEFIHQHYYDDDVGGLDHPGSFEFDTEAFEDRWRDSLIVIPQGSRAIVFAGFEEASTSVGAEVVCDFKDRSSLLSRLAVESDIDEELIKDFFALGYVRLQIELMTRKLRYSSDLDCERFDETVLAAAKAAADGEVESAKEQIQSAFDQLTEEKNHYYPVAADFIDLVLLSDSIKASSIGAELDRPSLKNFVTTGSTLRTLAALYPKTIDAFKSCLEDGSLYFVAGPENELPDDLLSVETMLGQLSQSVATFESIVGDKPSVFMRRRAGLNASLPGMLDGLGFTGAIHATLDQGNIPGSYSNSMRWMGVDGGAVMATGTSPLNAANDNSFLDLGVRIGGELDSAHVSTVFFARWPTQTCDSYEDLKNGMKYGNVLGDFTDAASYFENVYDPGYGDSYEADEYEGPWFEQALGAGSTRPVSTFIDYWKNIYRITAARNVVSMLALQDKETDLETLEQLDQIQNQIELQAGDWTGDPDHSIEKKLDQIVEGLAKRFPGKLLNSIPWKRRMHLAQQPLSKTNELYRGKGAVKFAANNTLRCDSVVELSGFGLLTNPAKTVRSSSGRDQPGVDDGPILRNENFEVCVDPESGGIRRVNFYGKRGNLLSQQLAIRLVDPGSKQVCYSKSVCEPFETTTLSMIASEIKTSGQFVDWDGNVLGRFVQTLGLQRGRNVIDVDVTISDLDFSLLSDKDMVVSRIAWSDETAELYCDIQGGRHPVRKPIIEAPHFVEVDSGDNRFAMLTNGLPWHRRASKKRLDSILIAGKEKRRSFKFGIAINPESSMQQAVAEMHPLPTVEGDVESRDHRDEAEWLLHLANRNVVSTWSQPVVDEDQQWSGLRIRFQETDGAGGTLKLYCRRELTVAVKESLDGRHLRDITLGSESGQNSEPWCVVETSFAAREYFQICLRWAKS